MAHEELLKSWRDQRDRLEAELATHVPAIDLEARMRTANRHSVAQALPPGTALVEFVRFNVFDFTAVRILNGEPWKPARYLAFVLAGAEPDGVRLVDLGEADPIDRMIAKLRADIAGESEDCADRNMTKRRAEPPRKAGPRPGLSLRESIFDPISEVLDGRREILLAPDGDLSRLPFEVLPTGDERCLIDDYRISYIATGRDALRFGVTSIDRPTLPLVIADPDFDLVNSGSTKNSRASGTRGPGPRGVWTEDRSAESVGPETKAGARRIRVERTAGDRSRDTGRSRYQFDRLAGTRVEGKRIAELLGVQPWLDADALEGRLKTECRSPVILHLATHGFFLEDQGAYSRLEPHGTDITSGLSDDWARLVGPMLENPLLRSGIALAGANMCHHEDGLLTVVEDGLLTAEDVSGLDLLGTELVVLSACDTGLGEIHVGEGVFGLRRAFLLAGAKTLVMSLWKVPGRPNARINGSLLRVLAGRGRAEALREAQLAMKSKYTDTFYWGAFICQGDPSPLIGATPGTSGSGNGP